MDEYTLNYEFNGDSVQTNTAMQHCASEGVGEGKKASVQVPINIRHLWKRDICEGGRKQRGNKKAVFRMARKCPELGKHFGGWNSGEAAARPPCSLTAGKVNAALVLASASYCHNFPLTRPQFARLQPWPTSFLYRAAYLGFPGFFPIHQNV